MASLTEPRPTPTPDRIDAEAGGRVRALRRERGLSRAALGAACNVSGQQIEKYETGVNRLSVSRLYLIAAALGVSPFDLFPHTDPPSSPSAAAPTAAQRVRAARLARLALEMEAGSLEHLIGLAEALVARGAAA